MFITGRDSWKRTLQSEWHCCAGICLEPWMILVLRASRISGGRGERERKIHLGLVPRPHPRGEKKGSGYNTTSRPGLGGHNQHIIVSDHVLTYAICGIL